MCLNIDFSYPSKSVSRETGSRPTRYRDRYRDRNRMSAAISPIDTDTEPDASDTFIIVESCR
ncbi:hypothetical protein D3OALGA1CA_4985 [Olavius algarvensis associated proteobacterium Delta 3]|nr:hypothetical protein D3OALGA1CA_4985 [Olavius algarvensis associated proteobacterium Delta 3]